MGFTHDPEDEDASYAEFRFVFVEHEGASAMGGIESHIHNVRPQLLVESLIHAAEFVLTESISEDTFGDAVPDHVREQMKTAMARQFLGQYVASMGRNEVFHVPNDASELFND